MKKTQGVRLSSDGETINMSEGEGGGPGPGMQRLTFPDPAGWVRELSLGIWWDHWGETLERQKRPEGSWPGQTKSETGTTKSSQCPAWLKENNMRLWESVMCTQGDPCRALWVLGCLRHLSAAWESQGGKTEPQGLPCEEKSPPYSFLSWKGQQKVLGYRAQHLTTVTLWVKAGGGESLGLQRALWPCLAITGTNPGLHAHLAGEMHSKVPLPPLRPLLSLKSLTH